MCNLLKVQITFTLLVMNKIRNIDYLVFVEITQGLYLSSKLQMKL